MKYDYDVITIGLGPAGMAVSVMGAEMGLKVCAVEKHMLGGECMNVGCIPSKSLLRMAKARSLFDKLQKLGLAQTPKPDVVDPFPRISRHLEFISEKKTMKMFDKVDMIYQKGHASFVDNHTVRVAGKNYTAKRIFICAGTKPDVPNFDGIENIDYLTNETIFSLEEIPRSMIVAGGGAIACEMAQAFSRLGCEVTIIIRGSRLMWRQNPEATDIIEETFRREGITIIRWQKPVKFEQATDGTVVMHTDSGAKVSAEKLLVAAGRKMDYDEMNLSAAGVKYSSRGIEVNRYLQTSSADIYACGDCNGFAQFSHAAMHQGMIAIMNSMMPFGAVFKKFFKKDFRKFPVPWTVFTDPPLSHVGMTERELDEKGIKYETIKSDYADYGAAIAEAIAVGHVKVFVSKTGKIFGVDIIGEGSGEMINEWSLAVQNKLRMHNIMMTQHSFPTMGFLSKRVSEIWMMNRMKSKFLQTLCRVMFRF